MTIKHQISAAVLIALSTSVVITSCDNDEEYGGKTKQAIAFASVTSEQEVMTRATKTLGEDFVVYGFKNDGTNLVFKGYDVFYNANSASSSEDNTNNYYYVKGSQTIKYWDYSATNYRFWGYNKSYASAYNETTHTLTYTCDAKTLATSCLCSKTKTVIQANFGKVVQLQFLHPASTIQVYFYTTEALRHTDHIDLTNISFAPATAGDYIVNNGTLEVKYDASSLNETYTTTAAAGGSLSELTFKPVTLTDANASTPTAVVALNPSDENVTALFPLSTSATSVPFVLSLDVDGDAKQAVVPDVYMNWLPNYRYTYYFKITEAGKKLEFVDLIIDPWLYGGALEEEWSTW